MSNLGKKILSAFVEVRDEETTKSMPVHGDASTKAGMSAPTPVRVEEEQKEQSVARDAQTALRFAEYFDKLFNDANLPGPDYYEFSKMIVAMHLVPDERARYFAAYAGLQVQGLDKQKLLSTAAEYVKILDADAIRFQQTVDVAVQEKVGNRSAEAEEKAKRIVLLTQEIQHLRDEIAAIEEEVRQNQEKLSVNGNAYAFESQRRKQQINTDIEKINQYIQ